MESRIESFNSNTNYDESSFLIGQELANFVIKTSQSLHNVINTAKSISAQQTLVKRKSSFKRKHIRTKSIKTKSHQKVSSNDKTTSSHNVNNNDRNDSTMDSTKSSTEINLDYDFEMISSSCEDLYEIPMEELLSSPSWKQIVQQNSFIWP